VGEVIVSVDQAVRNLIWDVTTNGMVTAGVSGLSVGSDRPTRELLNLQLTVNDPADRVSHLGHGPFRLTTAVARAVWMLAGNDRVDDIAFYEPGVARFSDNGRVVPGSSFGRRLREVEPGLDQLEAVIGRLRADPQSRRALAVVYTPIDAVRESKDIPCLLACNFRRRDDGLHATTIMRSNNVYRLAPYNLFELSLLAEIVAAELSVPFASLTHYCLSAHIYEDEVEEARQWASLEPRRTAAWPSIPKSASPLRQTATLIRLEGTLRSDVFDEASFHEWADVASTELNTYWLSILMILGEFVARKRHISISGEAIRSLISPELAAIRAIDGAAGEAIDK
jgi:thymidylate synthase